MMKQQPMSDRTEQTRSVISMEFNCDSLNASFAMAVLYCLSGMAFVVLGEVDDEI